MVAKTTDGLEYALLVTHVQWTANSTRNISSRRIMIEPTLVELAKSFVWWAGSTDVCWNDLSFYTLGTVRSREVWANV